MRNRLFVRQLPWMMGIWLLLLAAPVSHAQSSGPLNVLKINPLSLFAATLNLKYERVLNERFSAQLGAYGGVPRIGYNADSLPNGIRYRMFGIIPELRFHVNFDKRDNPAGLFLGAFASYVFVKQRYPSMAFDPDAGTTLHAVASLRRHVVGLGFVLGYELMIHERLALEGFAGAQYTSSSTKRIAICTTCDGNEDLIGRPGLRFDGMEPRIGLGIGYAF